MIEITMDQSWRYASGEAMARFAAGLRERRIQALLCDGCGRRYLPPRPFCGRCRKRLHRWLAVEPVGRLEAWTVVHYPSLDGRSGEMREAPYGMALIRLDGADCTLNHFIDVSDPARLRIGARVRAVWRDELRGAMDDIRCFEVLP